MPGNWVATIDLGLPYEVTAAGTGVPRCRYIKIEFSDRVSAMAAMAGFSMSLGQDHPVVAGEVLSDPPGIMGNDKGEDSDRTAAGH